MTTNPDIVLPTVEQLDLDIVRLSEQRAIRVKEANELKDRIEQLTAVKLALMPRVLS